ncbi:M20 metallopeptidase family protein [Bacillus horti]|uniref:Amidohydrolase n=1 Tax=Caldalkalibacillus horti TaxID=77523 RepID=A0ABT9W2T9_9BACI|nr:amidohydrolase [Bacillus horti]MDQ0167389.1 amidohydrolase [Bacillus horti]
MNETKQESQLLADAKNIHQELIAWRRHLHQHPELGFEENDTSLFVQERLRQLGIEFQSGIGRTGVVGLIKGDEPGPTVALRADMDALPIQDAKNVPYASKIEGKAHLCGHDAHTTILLGAATLLTKNKPKKGQVKLIFQPAEEGFGGANEMIKDGVLKNPDVEIISGLHVHHTAETGFTTVCPGLSSAATDMFNLTIHGKGGHAAHPHLSVDSIAVTSEVVSALQQIVSRQVDPIAPLVITIGKIEGGYARNVIAPSVRLEGTVRTLDLQLRSEIEEKMNRVVKGICDAFGATHELEYEYGYPSVINDETLIPILQEASDTILGTGKLSLAKPSMGGEDFSYYAQQVPGIFFRLGIRNESKGTTFPLHHPMFDIDEDALPLGSAMLTQFALSALRRLENS